METEPRMPESESVDESTNRAGEKTFRIINGIKCHRVKSGYTVQQYFSHEGPGWDTRERALKKYAVKDASELPDEPYYYWEPNEKQ